MNPVVRSSIAALVTSAAFYYIYWIPFATILEIGYGCFQWMWIIRVVASFVAAAVVAQYTWRHKSWAPRGPLGCVILGAAVLGGIGLSAGWFAPMIFYPGPQAPMLSIMAGVLGFLLGAIGGGFYWYGGVGGD